MRLSIFKRGEILKDQVIFEGEARGTSYFSFKDLYKKCTSCQGTGKTDKIDGLEVGEDIPCKICHRQGRIRLRIDIALECNGKYTYLKSCTCMHHALHGGVTDMKNLCSFVVAVYVYLTERNKYKFVSRGNRR